MSSYPVTGRGDGFVCVWFMMSFGYNEVEVEVFGMVKGGMMAMIRSDGWGNDEVEAHAVVYVERRDVMNRIRSEGGRVKGGLVFDRRQQVSRDGSLRG